MKKILVPIDYSYDALDGLDYAIELAKVFKAKLILFHVYSIGMAFSEALKKDGESSRSEIAIGLLDKLAKDRIGGNEAISYEVKVAAGEVIKSILQETENEPYHLVVMGTRDKHSFLDKWLGSVSIGVGQQCAIPVLLIPHGSNFELYERILVATDYQINQQGVLDFLVKWNDPFKAFLKFLHVKTSKQDAFREESNEIIKKYYHKEEVHFSFEIELKEGIDIPAVIYQTAIQENMDLIVLTAEKKSGLQSLLLKSTSNELIIRSLKPIMLLHPNNQNLLS